MQSNAAVSEKQALMTKEVSVAISQVIPLLHDQISLFRLSFQWS
jgi:hypothetical protein